MTRPRLTAVAIATLTLAAPAAAAQTAQASGSYVVSACSPSTSAGAWQPINTFPAALSAGNQCGGPAAGPFGVATEQGALFGEDLIGSAASTPAGGEAGWTFTAPPGTQIVAVSSYRSLATSQVDLEHEVGLFADGAPIDACRTPPGGLGCSELNTQGAVTESGLHASGLFFGVKCDPGGIAVVCVSGGTTHFGQADLYSVRVTLAEAAGPSVSGVGGALWGGGVVSGIVPVTFAASDPSGISSVAVLGPGGAQVAVQAQACDFSLAQPCPELPSGALGVSTVGVPDGPVSFTLSATNAAGNTTSVVSPSVVVDNNGPPSPTGFTATAVGTTALRLAWVNPPAPPEPVTGAQAQLCQAVCGAPVAVSAAGSAQIAVPGPGSYSVRLALVDSAGKTGAPATAAVTIAPPGGGGGGGVKPPGAVVHTRIAAVVSGRRLRVSGTIAAGVHGPLRVSWRAKSRAGRVLGSGSRRVAIGGHRIAVTFTLSAREVAGVTHVAVRSGRRVIAGVLARRHG